MKKLFFVVILTTVFSCTKNIEESNSFEINGNLIEINNNYLKFESSKQFYEIVNDYYEHDELYFSYFQNHRPIENSFIVYDDFITIFENREWKNKAEVLEYIKNIEGVKYEDSEFKHLFFMDYKNLFCNLDGIIQIGDYIYKYNDEGRYKIAASSFLNNLDFSNAEFESLNLQSRNKIIEMRSDFGGGCIDEVNNRRISCSNALDFGTDESPGCSFPLGFNAILIAEAKIKFQRKTWIGVWLNARADVLRIDIAFEGFDSDGNKVLDIVDFRESTDAYKTKWASTDSFCANCSLTYSFTDYEFDFRGDLGLTVYSCEHDLFLNVNDTNLCP